MNLGDVPEYKPSQLWSDEPLRPGDYLPAGTYRFDTAEEHRAWLKKNFPPLGEMTGE